MLKKRRIKQLYTWLVCLAAVFSFLPQSALASGPIDTEQPVSMTLRYQKEQAMPGVEFSLYRVADVSENATFQLTGDFAAYQVSLDQPTIADWRALAGTLAAYADRDGLTPLDSGRTGKDGTLRFPNQQETLWPGLYLVVGESHTSGKYTYTPSPFLVCLPNLDEETDLWVYDETVNPKYIGEKEDSTITRKVLKVWEDDGNEGARPEKIVVQLLRNGQVYDTVTLSEKNNWRHTWSGLNPKYNWQVVEETVPPGYTVSIGREGITFVVTNTFHPDQPEEPEEPDRPAQPDEPDQPDKPDKPGEPGGPGSDSSKEPSLPQTGALWWPVPVLAGSGMLLCLLGWVQAQKRRREDDR